MVVVAWASLGGAERSALSLARHLYEHEGVRVDVLAFTTEDGRLRDVVEELKIAWHPFSLTWHGGKIEKIWSLAELAFRLRRLRPDVVLPYTSRPNVLCGLVWRATGASLCVWNQQDVIPPRKFSRALQMRAASNASLVIANSEAAGDYVQSFLGVPVDRVRVISEGVQRVVVHESGASWRSRLGIDGTALVVSMLANLHRGKDHETLLRAWRVVVDGVRESGRDAVLLLAGRPSGSEDAVKALAFDLELGRSVRFLGEVSDVGGVLEATDIAVLSSRSESAPHALLESMSLALPVAATDVPGIREIVGEAQYPFLAGSGDADGLARAILALDADPALRRELGRANRKHALARAPVPAAEATAAAIAMALRGPR